MFKGKSIWRVTKIIYQGGRLRFLLCIVLLLGISLLTPIKLIAINNLIQAIILDETLIWNIVLFLLVQIAANSTPLLNLIGSYLWITAEISLQVALISKTTEKDLSFYDTPNFYNSLEKAKNSYKNAVGVTMMFLSAIFMSFFSVIFLLGYLIQITPSMVFLVVLIAVVKVVSYRYETSNLTKQREVHAPNNRRRDIFSSYIWSKDSRVFGVTKYFFKKWLDICKLISKQTSKLERKNIVFRAIIDFITFIGYAIMMYYVVILRSAGGSELVGEIIVMFIGMESIFSGLNTIITQFSAVMKNEGLSKELLDYISQSDGEPYKKTIRGEREIQLSGVDFAYPANDVMTLCNINVNVNMGEKIAIVGVNGSGKTTLAKLLSGLYRPTHGSIYYGKTFEMLPNGHNNVSFMFQDVQAYDLSLHDNITISDYQRDNKESIESLCEKIFGESWEMQFPMGVQTFIGRTFGGIELSGGEKQRLSLGRAVYRDCTLLFFDEPTSAIDPLAEERLYKELLDLSEGKTTFVVTHRLSFVRNVDRIFVMKDGRLIEDGSFEKLMKNDGEFSRLYAAQEMMYK